MNSHWWLWLLWLLLGIGSGNAVLECPLTSFNHFYEFQNEDGSTGLRNHTNNFPATAIKDYAMPKDLCVDASGLPVVRRCLESVQWEDLGNVTCRELDQADSELSRSLNHLQFELIEGISDRYSDAFSALDIMENISHIISQDFKHIRPVDVVSVNKIIHEVAKEPKNVAICTELVGIYGNLMATNRSVLEISARLNATNDLLYSFEDYTNDLAPKMAPRESCAASSTVLPSKDLIDVKVHDGVQVMIGSNLSVFYMYPECSRFTGIAIYSEAAPEREGCPHHRFWYRFLQANQSQDALKAEPNLLAATYLTEQLWTALREDGVSYLVLKIYANSALFVDTSAESGKLTPGSHVLSINIPQAPSNLPHPLVFLLRNTDYEKSPMRSRDRLKGFCGYWNYDTWKTNGITRDGNGWVNEPVAVCYTSHLTQFAFLLGASCMQQNCPFDVDIDDPWANEALLDTTTAIGCGLSLLGLLAIWLTAAISRRWRSQPTTKLLLNMCLAMTLLFVLMLLLYLNEWFWRYSFEPNTGACIALGALFQYAVLLLFSWMLIIGILQYRRHVIVFVDSVDHAILHMAVLAWLLPLLPTLLLVSLSPTSYTPVRSGDIGSVCYPFGSGLVYGVLLPIGLVLVANVFTFLCIFCKVMSLKDRNGHLIWQQLRLFSLLFFLLGLAWIFGICSYFRLGFLVTFLFCLTATIQGVVLFVYFVLFNKLARSAWCKLFCRAQVNGMPLTQRTRFERPQT